jgi:type II secretory pathway component PulF
MFQVLHYLGWTTWEPLFFRGITRRYHAAVILRTLASQVTSAIPIHTSLVAMGSKYPQRHIRDRLQAAAARVSRGESWQKCLQTENLISRGDADVLAAAERVGNLPWALREIADGILRRLRYRITACMRILIPLALVAIGCVVGLIGAAILSSISAIVLELA